ncbi:hypothetical protein E1B28_009601 [Marasmius oreades]|uniref:Uncharacterized protein n=1 Tax=Marasmius oreades TaxID=181124 RepID=A0A9P7RW37_9AGAR|nr:uncharacterized protein E1B28_009601 [Marasmius oreades]KAG7090487.1 hypothetical protein E1B28_009601 [Marasmius oreades]
MHSGCIEVDSQSPGFDIGTNRRRRNNTRDKFSSLSRQSNSLFLATKSPCPRNSARARDATADGTKDNRIIDGYSTSESNDNYPKPIGASRSIEQSLLSHTVQLYTPGRRFSIKSNPFHPQFQFPCPLSLLNHYLFFLHPLYPPSRVSKFAASSSCNLSIPPP